MPVYADDPENPGKKYGRYRNRRNSIDEARKAVQDARRALDEGLARLERIK